jgi:IS30 family transposase
MGYKYWTQAEDAELVLMREAKVSTKEIATALKRSPSSVMNRISTKGIPYGNTPSGVQNMRASRYRQSADMQIPYRIQNMLPDKQTGVLNSIQNTAKNQHSQQANRELDHSAYSEFAKGQLNPLVRILNGTNKKIVI